MTPARLVLRCTLVAGFAAGCAGDSAEQGSLDSGTTCDLCGGGCLEREEQTGGAHVDGEIAYPDPPPMGGDHNPCWAEWGIQEFYGLYVDQAPESTTASPSSGCMDDTG